VEIEELIARECIRDLVARYNAQGDSGRIDDLMALFAEDAVVDVADGETYRGRAEIRELFEGAVEEPEDGAPVRFIRHFTATHQIDVEGPERARGRCYFVVFTERGADHWGRYIDTYVRVDGRWLFSERRAVVDARESGGWGDRAHRRLHGGGEGS
jgi:ketosteroid isomerase-like protein